MSADHASTGSAGNTSSNVGVWVVIVTVIVLFVVAMRIDPLSSPAGGGSATPDAKDATKAEAAKTAELSPSTEMPLPEGPNADDFQNACLTCHSARLPLGQPPFGREKWGEIVHKMAAAYGAPLTPEIESKVVDYIVAVRPPEA